MPRPAPPEVIETGTPSHLRRHRVSDAEAIAAAVELSMTELRDWMPWATAEATDPDFQTRRLRETVGLWEEGADYSYVVLDDEDEVIGVMSLMARLDARALEIGYWLRSDRTGRGIATSCVAALTRAALALPGTDRVEIHCDERNRRSAAIPRRLGYRFDRIQGAAHPAPGGTGHNMVWVFPPDEASVPRVT